MEGIILHKDERGDLFYVHNSAFNGRFVDLKRENLTETNIEDLTKKLAPQYGVCPEELTVSLWDGQVLTGGKRIGVSYRLDKGLTKQLRTKITEYIDSCRNPRLSMKIFEIRGTEQEFGITPDVHKAIMTSLRRIVSN